MNKEQMAKKAKTNIEWVIKNLNKDLILLNAMENNDMYDEYDIKDILIDIHAILQTQANTTQNQIEESI